MSLSQARVLRELLIKVRTTPGLINEPGLDSPQRQKQTPSFVDRVSTLSFSKGSTMAKYMLIESRDPFEDNDVQNMIRMATDLVKQGDEVTLFLVQNGVLPARPSIRSDLLRDASKAGVRVLADSFSLRERGIENTRLLQGVKAAELDTVIDALADGHKTIWH